MTDADTPEGPLEAAAGTAGPGATEAFSLLGNETRLSILLALWEAFEPFADGNAVPFSDLQERVGMRDSGQFNYHLDKLTGHFVRKTDAGYELRRAGQQLVRTVIAGAGIDEPSFERAGIDIECSFCGAPTEVLYRDEWIYIVCTECDGFFAEGDDQPEGSLSGAALDPAGVANRTPEEMLRAAWAAAYQDLQSAIEGVCDACSGEMEPSLDVCADHETEGVCENCGRRFAVMARFECSVCKNHHTAPPRTVVTQHPAVIAFYYDRGVPFQYGGDDFESFRERSNLVGEHTQSLLSEDPVRVEVTIGYEGDELTLTLDDELDVIEVSVGGE